jgi:ribonuclease P protein component
MVLSYLRDAEPGSPRVGIVTSRRVGTAVDRVRTRRRFREIIRHALPLLADQLWIVLIARKAAVAAPLVDLRSEWNTLASRAGLFHA